MVSPSLAWEVSKKIDIISLILFCSWLFMIYDGWGDAVYFIYEKIA